MYFSASKLQPISDIGACKSRATMIGGLGQTANERHPWQYQGTVHADQSRVQRSKDNLEVSAPMRCMW
jgi:hypothetical protein